MLFYYHSTRNICLLPAGTAIRPHSHQQQLLWLTYLTRICELVSLAQVSCVCSGQSSTGSLFEASVGARVEEVMLLAEVRTENVVSGERTPPQGLCLCWTVCVHPFSVDGGKKSK